MRIADCVAAYHLALVARSRTRESADAMRGPDWASVRSALEAGLPDGWRSAPGWRCSHGAIGHARQTGSTRAARAGSFVARMAICISAIMCLWQGRPVLFDALEFDEAMATIDLGYDLGFLLMDIDHRVGRQRRPIACSTATSPALGMLRSCAVCRSSSRCARWSGRMWRPSAAGRALAGTYLRAAREISEPGLRRRRGYRRAAGSGQIHARAPACARARPRTRCARAAQRRNP